MQKVILLLIPTKCFVDTREVATQKYEICSKLTIKKPGQRHCCRSGVLNIKFDCISYLLVLFLLLTLSMYLFAGTKFHEILHIK